MQGYYTVKRLFESTLLDVSDSSTLVATAATIPQFHDFGTLRIVITTAAIAHSRCDFIITIVVIAVHLVARNCEYEIAMNS